MQSGRQCYFEVCCQCLLIPGLLSRKPQLDYRSYRRESSTRQDVQLGMPVLCHGFAGSTQEGSFPKASTDRLRKNPVLVIHAPTVQELTLGNWVPIARILSAACLALILHLGCGVRAVRVSHRGGFLGFRLSEWAKFLLGLRLRVMRFSTIQACVVPTLNP